LYLLSITIIFLPNLSQLFYSESYEMPRAPGRPREFDKDQALDTALRMFWRHGYEGTSISALAAAVGVTVPSLYLAFGNKESLFMQAVEHYGRYSAKLYEDAFRQKSARDIARGILLGEVDLVAGGDTPDGCLMVQSALATSPESEAVRQAMAKLRIEAEAEVAERFEHAAREGDLPVGWSPRALACYVMTITAGMAVQAKSGVSREDLLQVAEMAMLIWPDRNINPWTQDLASRRTRKRRTA
jgi:AcrR family transcriptional regulator